MECRLCLQAQAKLALRLCDNQ